MHRMPIHWTELTAREMIAVLNEELARLPAPCRAALVLCYLEKQSYEQAGAMLAARRGRFNGGFGKGAICCKNG